MDTQKSEFPVNSLACRMVLGAAMRSARERVGLRPIDLARALRVVRPTILNWESGDSTPDCVELALYAAACGVSPRSLIEVVRAEIAAQRARNAQAGA